MAGKLYGVGIGPGDPELLTFKAARIIDKCQVLAVPGENPVDTTAYKIVRKAYQEVLSGEDPDAYQRLRKKELVGIHMPMTKDEKRLKDSHEKGINILRNYLDRGEDVAFLTLGDPTVYSTYIYLHKEIAKAGYRTEIVSGITSFCAAAARVGMEIAKQSEQIHIIPASYQIEEALELPGTKILMKAGKKMPQVKALLEHAVSEKNQVMMIENCGMDGEKIYDGLERIPETAGYYTLLFVKDGEEQ